MLAGSTRLPSGLYFPSDTQYELLLPTVPLPLSLALLLLFRQLLPVSDFIVLFGMFRLEFVAPPVSGCSDGDSILCRSSNNRRCRGMVTMGVVATPDGGGGMTGPSPRPPSEFITFYVLLRSRYGVLKCTVMGKTMSLDPGIAECMKQNGVPSLHAIRWIHEQRKWHEFMSWVGYPRFQFVPRKYIPSFVHSLSFHK